MCNVVLVLTLIHGSEYWVWMQKHMWRMTAMEMRFLRGVCGCTRRDRKRNTLVYDECNVVKNVVKKVWVSQLRWFGHVERMSSERLVKRIYVGEIEGERMRGRPTSKWIDAIEPVLLERKFLSGKNKRAWMKCIMNVEEAKVVCQNRNDWRKLITG